MAKVVGSDRAGIIEWFGAQSLEDQERILVELTSLLERRHAGRIRELEVELARLKGALRRETLNDSKRAERTATEEKVSRTAMRRTQKDAKKSDSPLSGRKVAAKFRHPKNKELTWAGRGMQPKWMQKYLADGGKLEALRVK